MRAEWLKGHLDVMVLATLWSGPAHGYVIIERLRLRSGAIFDMPEGTIYPALHRLEKAGLLHSWWEEVGGRKRRIYALTPQGQAAVLAGAQEWRQFAQGMNGILSEEGLA